MAKDKAQAREVFNLFQQEEQYKKDVCLIISPDNSSVEKTDNQKVIRQFKSNSYPHIAIVVDMLTTGFDLPTLQIVYLNQVIESPSSLWQKISRVNRRNDEKKIGRVIDFVNNK